jgi:hypothetical protein
VTSEINVSEGADAAVTVPVRAAVTVQATPRAAGAVVIPLRPSSSAVAASPDASAAVTTQPPDTTSVSYPMIPGPPGPQGPPGPAGGTYRHVQANASAQWTIQHNLGFYPAVTLVDSTGREFVAELTFPDMNTAVATLSAATGGEAYCS